MSQEPVQISVESLLQDITRYAQEKAALHQQNKQLQVEVERYKELVEAYEEKEKLENAE